MRTSPARAPTSATIPKNPDLKIAWKYLYTSKDTWLGPKQDLGAIGSVYNLTMDPFEKYDMTFNGAVSTRMPTTSPGRYAGYDNGWVLSLMVCRSGEFDKSIVDFPNIKRFPGGASNDMSPNLQHPANPVPLMDIHKLVQDDRRRRLAAHGVDRGGERRH